MILKVDLNNLVAKSEHNSVFGSHPLFNVDLALAIIFQSIPLLASYLSLLSIVFEVGSEMLEKSHFLLKLLGILLKRMSSHNVLLFRRGNSLSFVVVESLSIRVDYYFS